MHEEIERAIKILTGKVVQSIQPDHALKFTQAALNLAHVKVIMTGDTGKKRTSAS